jgi:hypothetical protein
MTARLLGSLWLVTLLALASGHSVSAQTSELDGCPAATDYPCGAVAKVSRATVGSLLNALYHDSTSTYQSILKKYLGPVYGPHFIDWVVFIGKNNTIKQALIVDSTFQKGNLVRGRQALFAVVLSDTPLKLKKDPAAAQRASRAEAESTATGIALIAKQCAKEQLQCALQLPAPVAGGKEGNGSDTSASYALELSRTTLQYTREAALTAFIKSITKGIVGDAAPVVAVPDSILDVALLDVVMHDSATALDTARSRLDTSSSGGVKATGDTMFYVGIRRLALPNNALVRFTLRAHQVGKNYDLPGATSISRTVENASRNRFGASLGLGVTGNAPDTTFAVNRDSTNVIIKSSSAQWKPNAWVLAHIYLQRPELPIRPTSFSLVLGTNVGISDLFRDLLAGVSIDRLFGDVGLMGGLNFIERQTAEANDTSNGKLAGLRTRAYRKGRWFVGLNFAL